MRQCIKCGKIPDDGWFSKSGYCRECAEEILKERKKSAAIYKKPWFKYAFIFIIAIAIISPLLSALFKAQRTEPPLNATPDMAYTSPNYGIEDTSSDGGSSSSAIDVLSEEITDISGSGSGDTVISTEVASETGYGKIHFSHDGESNFVVKDITTDDLIINEIGQWSGGYLFAPGSHSYEITADGNWEYSVSAIEKGSRSGATGIGDDISGWFDSVEPSKVTFTHSGESNFIVLLYNPDTNDYTYTVNEIGQYKGEKYLEFSPTDRYIWIVTADGEWSISIG